MAKNKKFDPQNPRTKEELAELIRQTKAKFGIDDKDKSLLELSKVVDKINDIGPDNITKKINAFIAKQNKN